MPPAAAASVVALAAAGLQPCSANSGYISGAAQDTGAGVTGLNAAILAVGLVTGVMPAVGGAPPSIGRVTEIVGGAQPAVGGVTPVVEVAQPAFGGLMAGVGGAQLAFGGVTGAIGGRNWL